MQAGGGAEPRMQQHKKQGRTEGASVVACVLVPGCAALQVCRRAAVGGLRGLDARPDLGGWPGHWLWLGRLSGWCPGLCLGRGRQAGC